MLHKLRLFLAVLTLLNQIPNPCNSNPDSDSRDVISVRYLESRRVIWYFFIY